MEHKRKVPVPRHRRVAILQETKRKLLSVLHGYDKRTDECECCGMTLYEDFAEYKKWSNISSAISKITKAIELEIEDYKSGDEDAR
jgi:hypothetical protein